MISVYTDGCCVPNPGTGRFSFVVIKNDLEVLYKYQSKISDITTTNNRCECLGIIYALKWLHNQNVQYATIYTDSKIYYDHYVYMICFNKIKKIKKKGTKNQDLLNLMLPLVTNRFTIKWIKGHSGHKWNDLADQLASINSRG